MGDEGRTKLTVVVDGDASQAPFEQVRAQIAAQIAAGSLPPGTRLPTVRQLAADLGLAANTVAKSYRELEGAGLIETRGRGGTVVSAGTDQLGRHLLAAAEEYAAAARTVGATPAVARRTVLAVLEASWPGQ